MVKRLISANPSDVAKMNGSELKQAIKASEGRTICVENVVGAMPQSGDLTNAEVAKAFGADLILLNGFDCFRPIVMGVPGIPFDRVLGPDEEIENPIPILKHLTGRPIGINLEPVAENSDLMSEQVKWSSLPVVPVLWQRFKKQKKWAWILFVLRGIQEPV